MLRASLELLGSAGYKTVVFSKRHIRINYYLAPILLTVCIQVLDKSGEPVYEVDYKESRKTFTPSHIAVAIYKKMLGKVLPYSLFDS